MHVNTRWSARQTRVIDSGAIARAGREGEFTSPKRPGVQGGAAQRPLAQQMTDDEKYRRYVNINLPHARTVVQRVGRSLEALGAFGEASNGGAQGLHEAFERLEGEVEPFEEDPAQDAAIKAADAVAERARTLVAAILETPARGDRLGQHVRNLFECLGLAEEGASLSLRCGERPDSPMR